MGQDEEKKDGFKVVDRRRFDDSGNERADADEASPRSVSGQPVSGQPLAGAASAQPSRGDTATKEPRASAATAPEITFGSFILSFAHQALMQMGEVPPPPGVDLKQDLEGARQSIDIIALLERKTKGNLEPEEQRLITEVLHNLRMCFVAKTKG